MATSFSTTTEKTAPKKQHHDYKVNYAAIVKGEAAPPALLLPPPAVQPGWVQLNRPKGEPVVFTFGPPKVNLYLQDAAARDDVFREKCLLQYRIGSQQETQHRENDRLGDLSPYYNAVQDPESLLVQYENEDREHSYSSDESRSDED